MTAKRNAKRNPKQNAGKSDYERVYVIKDLEAGASIARERFTLAAMDLPVNTPVVDYRIRRIVGYWNGEGLSEHPVHSGERSGNGRIGGGGR